MNGQWAKLIVHLPKNTSLDIYYSLLEQDKLFVSDWFCNVMFNKCFNFQVSRGEDRKRWHKERVASVFAVQGGSASNDRGDCNR